MLDNNNVLSILGNTLLTYGRSLHFEELRKYLNGWVWCALCKFMTVGRGEVKVGPK